MLKLEGGDAFVADLTVLVIVFFILVSDDDTYTRITVCVRSAMCRVTGVMVMN